MDTHLDHDSNLSTSRAQPKPPQSAQAYKDYMEEMELKIRYMKNDIEFKQSQIISKKKATSGKVALLPKHVHFGRQPQNGLKKSPVTTRSDLKTIQGSTNTTCKFTYVKNTLHSRDEGSTIHNSKTSQYLSTIEKGSQGKSQYSSASNAMNQSGLEKMVQRSSIQGPGTNASSTFTYVKNSNVSCVQSVVTPSVAAKHGATNITEGGCAMQQVTIAAVPVISATSQHSNNLSVENIYSNSRTASDVSCSQAQCGNTNSVRQIEAPLTSTSNPVTTSVFSRLGDYSSAKPIYVSPDKSKAIWSQNPQRVVLSQSWSNRQIQLSTDLGLRQDKIPDSTCVSTTTGGKIAWTQETFTSDASFESAYDSKYKLLKGDNESKLLQKSDNISKSNAILPLHAASPGKMCNVPHRKIAHAHSTPKLNISAKIVGKYKMTRLSPNSTSQLAPRLFQSQVTPKGPLSDLKKRNNFSILHKLDSKSVDALAATAESSSRSHNKTPKLKLVVAAKVVSKYKLKRLSPTSSSKQAPQLFTNHPLPLSSGQSMSQRLTSKHKLDRRKSNTAVSHPYQFTSHSVARKKGLLSSHKKPGASFLTHSPMNRRQFKLDRRSNSSKGIDNRLHSKGIQLNSGKVNFQSKHKLDRRPVVPAVGCSITPEMRKRAALKRKSATSHYSSFPLSSGSVRQNAMRSRYQWRRLLSSNVKDLPLSGSPRQEWTPWRKNKHWFAVGKDMRNSPIMRQNLIMIRGVVYRASPWSMRKKGNAFKEHHGGKTKLITVRGSHFHTDSRGKRLFRAGSAHKIEQTKNNDGQTRLRSQYRSVDETAILAARGAVQRSIAVATAKVRRNTKLKWRRDLRQHCIFFGRFGKCHRGDACQFLHDPHRVAVCTRFLRGKCDVATCPFSHNASVHKMPVCLHFLQGMCSRDSCPYLHVRVNPNAPVCKDFCNGYCSLGEECKKLHSLVCPGFAISGVCSKGEQCTLLHRRIKRDTPKNPPKFRQSGRKRRKSSTNPNGRSKKQKFESKDSTHQTMTSMAGEAGTSSGAPSHTSSDTRQLVCVEPLCTSTETDQRPSPSSDIAPKSNTLTLSNPSDSGTAVHITNTDSNASPLKASEPLASQPSFISLLDFVSPQSEPGCSKFSASGDCQQIRPTLPNIRPLFLAQRLAGFEKPRQGNKL